MRAVVVWGTERKPLDCAGELERWVWMMAMLSTNGSMGGNERRECTGVSIKKTGILLFCLLKLDADAVCIPTCVVPRPLRRLKSTARWLRDGMSNDAMQNTPRSMVKRRRNLIVLKNKYSSQHQHPWKDTYCL